jgi:hypothetical protein
MDDDNNDDYNNEEMTRETENTLSSSSSLTSGTDVYMDAVEIINDELEDNKSGERILFFFSFTVVIKSLVTGLKVNKLQSFCLIF